MPLELYRGDVLALNQQLQVSDALRGQDFQIPPPAPLVSPTWESPQRRQPWIVWGAAAGAGAKAPKAFGRDSKEAKSNIVPNPALSQAPRPVAPR